LKETLSQGVNAMVGRLDEKLVTPEFSGALLQSCQYTLPAQRARLATT
jgi:hypothetical protein